MNKKSINLVMVLLLAGNASLALAHEQQGNLTSAAGAGATDVYLVTCFTDSAMPSQQPTHQLFFSVRSDTINNTILSGQAIKAQANGIVVEKTTTDVTAGDINFSPTTTLVSNVDADQDFYVLINHTGSANGSYLLDYHCQDAQGIHTGTDIVTIQQQ